MAPLDESTEIAELETSGSIATEKKPISTILIIISMQTEALPLVAKFQLSEDQDSVFPKGVPWVRYHGIYKDLKINIIWPGKDQSLGVDCVGTISASLVTYASIQALKPDLIINAGTAGGFKSQLVVLRIVAKLLLNASIQALKPDLIINACTADGFKAKGACVGDVFLASRVAFHDRRIPIPVFDQYGIGARKTFPIPNIFKELKLKEGKLSTGDSLDMSPHDEAAIAANDATVKDMEGAAVAYVSDLLSVPAIFVKAVTDIVDGDKPTAEEFLRNLVAVTAALDQAVTQVVDFINGKFLSEL